MLSSNLKRAAAAGPILLWLSITGSNAQNSERAMQSLSAMVGTMSVDAETEMSSGSLSGCHFMFTAVAQDLIYRQGAYIGVSGNVGVRKANNNFGIDLKVVIFDIDSSKSSFVLKPSAPSRAYLVGQDFQTNLSSLIATVPSDTPGALVSLFQFHPSFGILMNGIRRGKITIAFNRDGGDKDIRLPLELDVKSVSDSGQRQRSDEAIRSFGRCIKTMMPQ
ncbi:hypothetical protein [Phyllobacterium zundukense]|uniref:Uncharacterized protein n=1 Tax=Phyllobacterium zundukense TaxID=1867719 RepID=A0ACD4CXD5_9HYPH|nr:hypothetical protein [Phyllobacterium zundukense]UXN58213.1 hypothetical protein N8E88_05180 [Phyllobacterium zundukense]